MKTMNVNIHEIHTEVFTEEDQFGVQVNPHSITIDIPHDDYDPFSMINYRLVHLAFVTMARNNPEFCKALLATGNKKLRHSIGGTDPLKTILTESEFCSILNDIRERLTKRGENVNS